MPEPCRRAFTLIELLIVVAIIAILAAIAVPNFLSAQIRAKVAKVEADFASLCVAMESYYVDNHDYIPALPGAFFREMAQLTTSVGYLAQIPLDPFKPYDICPQDRDHDTICLSPTSSQIHDGGGYNMIRFSQNSILPDKYYYGFQSLGPDHDYEVSYYLPMWTLAWRQTFINNTYDPSNGLISSGEIFRFGPSDFRNLR